MKTPIRWLMAGIAIVAGCLALTFQPETAQQSVYRKLADRHDELAASFRRAERQAWANGDAKLAKKHREHVERLEKQGWVYRWESYQRFALPGWYERKRRSQ